MPFLKNYNIALRNKKTKSEIKLVLVEYEIIIDNYICLSSFELNKTFDLF